MVWSIVKLQSDYYCLVMHWPGFWISQSRRHKVWNYITGWERLPCPILYPFAIEGDNLASAVKAELWWHCLEYQNHSQFLLSIQTPARGNKKLKQYTLCNNPSIFLIRMWKGQHRSLQICCSSVFVHLAKWASLTILSLQARILQVSPDILDQDTRSGIRT